MKTKEAAKKLTIAICTTVKSKSIPKQVCEYKSIVSGKACRECTTDCWIKCGATQCPCDKVTVINPPYATLIDISRSGLYIIVRGRKYTIDGSKLLIF